MIPLESTVWLPWLVVVPFAGAALSFLVPRWAVAVGLFTGAAVAIGAVGLVGRVLRHGATTHAPGGWGAPLGIELYADGLSAWLVAVTALVGGVVSLFATGYFGHDQSGPESKRRHQRRYFWPLWLMLWAGLNALLLSGDLFNLYVTLELLGFSAVALTALDGTKASVTAAMRYLLASLLGSLCFLLGVALLYGAYATLDLGLLAQRVQPDAATWVGLAAMTGGLLVKGAVFPLHFWLPPAHASATAPVSALLSALVVKAPLYILVRLWCDTFAVVQPAAVGALFGLLGAAALLGGGVQALRQPRLKLVVAYSTVAQMGYLLLVFPLAADAASGFTAWSGAMFLVGAHACAKAAMFLAAGVILHSLGHDDMGRMAGVAQARPKAVFALALAGTSLMGLPPSGGFVAKWLLLSAAIQQEAWTWVVVMAAGSVLALAYVMRVLGRTLAAPKEELSVAPVPAVIEWTALLLALLAVAMGLVAFAPMELLGIGAPPAGRWMAGGGA